MILLILAFALATAKKPRDYTEAMSQLQSAVQSNNDDAVAACVEDFVNLLPTQYSFYGLGFTVGERNEITLVKTEHLYGSIYQIPINPMKMIDTECIYVAEKYSGSLALITEVPTTLKTCKHNAYRHFYQNHPYKPLISRNDHIKTSGVVQKNGHPLTVITPDKIDEREVKAFDLGDIGQNYLQKQEMTILAGHVYTVSYGTVKIKQFVVFAEVVVDKDTCVITKHYQTSKAMDNTIRKSFPNHRCSEN